jgi:hypothetical protein
LTHRALMVVIVSPIIRLVYPGNDGREQWQQGDCYVKQRG